MFYFNWLFVSEKWMIKWTNRMLPNNFIIYLWMNTLYPIFNSELSTITSKLRTEKQFLSKNIIIFQFYSEVETMIINRWRIKMIHHILCLAYLTHSIVLPISCGYVSSNLIKLIRLSRGLLQMRHVHFGVYESLVNMD